MPRPRRPTVVLASAPGTLEGIDGPLAKHGIRLIRISAVHARAVPSRQWAARLSDFTRPDTIVVTSRHAVPSAVEQWRHPDRRAAPPEFWAVGPSTARALTAAGVRRVRRPATTGSAEVIRALEGTRRRTVVYLRSDRAGPGVARALRRRGHRVLDLVVYRLPRASRLGVRARRELGRADLLVATSPSVLASLRWGLDRATFSRLCRGVPLVVLGERSLRAARGHGFRLASVAPPTTAQRFTRHLLHELTHARA